MAKLYVFNPEHDLALAANLSNFTSPLAGRKLRHDLGYIPALWAGDDDYILVDDVQQAEAAYGLLRAELGLKPKLFVDKKQLNRLYINKVEPWGWDLALRSFLLRYGVDAVPTEEEIAVIRELSHRRHAAQLLAQLQMDGTTGVAVEARCMDDVRRMMDKYTRIVVKAPWSSSGRGVRFIDAARQIHNSQFTIHNSQFTIHNSQCTIHNSQFTIDNVQLHWIENVIEKQGSVMVEPCYDKVMDFGMEFESDGEGHVSYLGLSLFHTVNGAYTGNIIANEETKTAMLNMVKLDNVKCCICDVLGEKLHGKYRGPFGVDMMVVKADDGEGVLLHPCVEINLRRTMGHVALAIPPYADGCQHVMEITKREDDFKVILSSIS